MLFAQFLLTRAIFFIIIQAYDPFRFPAGQGGWRVYVRFPFGAICVVGLAKVANQNPIHSVHRALAGSLSWTPPAAVYDVQFDTVCQITSDFLASLLIGLSLHTDLEEMISRVQSRYFGDSRRAITVILRDVAARLRECQGGGYN